MLNLPDTAKLHWGNISIGMYRFSEDFIYITLDSKIAIDVGCYGPDKYKNSETPFTVVVANMSLEDKESQIQGWGNPYEVHQICSEVDLAIKIRELADKYSIGGECYPPKYIPFFIEDRCNHCDKIVKYYLHDSIFYCHECGCKELTKQTKRHCPYCVKDTIHIINSTHPYCRECKNERGW